MHQATYPRLQCGLHHVFPAVFAICVILYSSTVAWAETSPPVRIAGSAWVGDAPTWVADGLGLFNRGMGEGQPAIEVELYGSGLEALRQLIAGDAEFALAATTPTALALAGALEPGSDQPAEIAVLASIALSNQSHYLVSLAGKGIQTAGDLAGQRVAIMFGTSSHYGWTRFSAFHGLDDAEVELVDLPVAEMAAALKDGQVDAAVIWQPWDASLRSAYGDEITILPMRMLYTVNWLLLSRTDFVASHPEVVERVLQAYIDAIESIHEDAAQAVQMHAAAVGVEVDELESPAQRMLWRVGMNWSVLVNLGAQFEWLSTWPELAGMTPPEPKGYLHGGPLKRISPELVTLPDYLLAGAHQ
jgi:ABC-type nitrate/sulfonate/bicarbonate transport system substrate-binding protein